MTEMHPGLLPGIRFFTRDTRIMSGLAVACGTVSRLEWAGDGEGIGPDTVYDLASVTKLFTGLCAVKLREQGKLDFDTPVCRLEPRGVGASYGVSEGFWSPIDGRDMKAVIDAAERNAK